MSITYNSMSEFDIVAKYTKESGFGTDIVSGLKSIKENFEDLDEYITDAYEEIVYQLSEFIKEGDYHV
jgi:mevalonate kinase